MAERQLDRSSLGDHIDRLYRAAWAMSGSREEAEDLVQETFLRVMSRPRLLRSDDDLGYLLCALRNTFLTARRRAGRRPSGEPFDDRLELIEDRRARAPHDAVEAREVYPAIAALPLKCRDALVAVDVLGLSYREAARALGVRPETITSRLYRGRKLVAARLRGLEAPAPAVQIRASRPTVGSGAELDQRAAAQAVR
jgi:RNA polymerase sigma-70 factor (ECF subfamily)